MKKSNLSTKLFSAGVATVLSVCMTGSMIPMSCAMAAEKSETVSTRNIAIATTSNNLTLGTLGKLTCEGDTSVQMGYNAEVIVELQQYDGGWNTIKTWSDSGSDYASVYETIYVDTDYSYRLKLTHKAYTSSWSLVESFTKYSETV